MKKLPDSAPPKNGPNAALLVIDVQVELFRKSSPVYRSQTLLDNLCSLIERAHQAGAPVFFIQHADGRWLVEDAEGWQLHPSLPLEGAAGFIRKRHGSAFEETTLESELDQKGAGAVVIAGLVTHGCVKATCLHALRLGYHTTLAADAHSSYSREAQALIDEWNVKLQQAGAVLEPSANIEFAPHPV